MMSTTFLCFAADRKRSMCARSTATLAALASRAQYRRSVHNAQLAVRGEATHIALLKRFRPRQYPRSAVPAWVRHDGWISPHTGRLLFGSLSLRCALGKTGVTAQKREGDGATPIGAHRILTGLINPARIGGLLANRQFWRPVGNADGWCDEPFHAAYNRPVRLPFSASHEKLMRRDHLYDRVLVLDWNITRRSHGRGSAIFFHQARTSAGRYLPTEGCIAIDANDFRRLMGALSRLKSITVL